MRGRQEVCHHAHRKEQGTRYVPGRTSLGVRAYRNKESMVAKRVIECMSLWIHSIPLSRRQPSISPPKCISQARASPQTAWRCPGSSPPVAKSWRQSLWLVSAGVWGSVFCLLRLESASASASTNKKNLYQPIFYCAPPPGPKMKMTMRPRPQILKGTTPTPRSPSSTFPSSSSSSPPSRPRFASLHHHPRLARIPITTTPAKIRHDHRQRRLLTNLPLRSTQAPKPTTPDHRPITTSTRSFAAAPVTKPSPKTPSGR